jgi:hypothetical protein
MGNYNCFKEIVSAKGLKAPGSGFNAIGFKYFPTSKYEEKESSTVVAV